MTVVVQDSFTDTDGTALTSHVGEVGATWVRHPTHSGSLAISDADRVRCASVPAMFYATGQPSGPDYDVEQDLIRKADSNGVAGPVGRLLPTEQTHYGAAYNDGGDRWRLYKFVNGSYTLLAAEVLDSIPFGVPHRMKLEMRGASIKLFVDGVERLAAEDSSITHIGYAGIRHIAVTSSNLGGLHHDNFTVTEPDTGGGSPTPVDLALVESAALASAPVATLTRTRAVSLASSPAAASVPIAPRVTRETVLHTAMPSAAAALASAAALARSAVFTLGEAAAATLAPSATVQFAKAVALGAAYSVAAPGALRFAAARAKRALLSIGLRLGI